MTFHATLIPIQGSLKLKTQNMKYGASFGHNSCAVSMDPSTQLTGACLLEQNLNARIAEKIHRNMKQNIIIIIIIIINIIIFQTF